MGDKVIHQSQAPKRMGGKDVPVAKSNIIEGQAGNYANVPYNHEEIGKQPPKS